jgi:uncharacterized protein YggE
MQKKWWAIIGAAVILSVVIIILAGCSAPQASPEIKGNISNQQQGIWVNGEGKVTAVPDTAILSVGVQAQAATVADARSQAADAMNKLITALKNGGVATKDIQTRNFNIQPVTRWDDTKQQQVTTGYQVTNTVTAKIRMLPQDSSTLDYKTGVIIDAVTAAGGDLTRINSLAFTIDNPATLQAQARQKAVVDAAAKAKQLADAAGVKLGKPVYISENSYTPTPIYRDVATKAAAASGTTTPISAGETDITIDVQIAYDIG